MDEQPNIGTLLAEDRNQKKRQASILHNKLEAHSIVVILQNIT